MLRPGATRIDDTEPARSSITIRHLMTHTSGLSYGIFDPLISATLSYRDAGRAFALAADRSQAMKVLLDFE